MGSGAEYLDDEQRAALCLGKDLCSDIVGQYMANDKCCQPR